jgi:ketosteroid isomerase-like protein
LTSSELGVHRLVALFVGCAVSVIAATESPEDTVRRVDQSWGDAFQSCNVKQMGNILSDELVFIVQNGVVQGKTEQMASVARCDMKQMTVRPEKIRVFGNTSVVYGTLVYRLEGPRANQGTLVYGRVYVRERGLWRMIQHQSTPSPPPAR